MSSSYDISKKNWSSSQKYRSLKSFSRHKLGVLGVIMLLVFFLTAIFAPVVIPNDPYTMKLEEPFLPMGSQYHPLGTDNFGRDILARLVYGARISLLIGIVVVSLAAVLGTVLGLLAGYYGGWVDFAVMRLVEVFYSFPFLILVIAVIAILGPQHIQCDVGAWRSKLAFICKDRQGPGAIPQIIGVRIGRKGDRLHRCEDYIQAHTPEYHDAHNRAGYAGHPGRHTLIREPGLSGLRRSAADSRMGLDGQ